MSANTSRPTSPAEELAEEALTPTEDDEYKKIAVAQCRRKSSVWKKTLNLKKQISKVNMKISTTIGEGVRRGSVFFGPTDGCTLSPVEMSPPEFPATTAGSSSSYADTDRDLAANVEKDIVQCMGDVELRSNDQSDDASADDSDSDNERRPSTDTEWKKRIMNQPQYFQTRRSDASEEMAVRTVAAAQEGGRVSRPSDLPLFDDNGRPVPMPRAKPRESRNQRLLSVPNIKYQRKESVVQKPGDVIKPKTRNASSSSTTSSFAGNLMRRFSKYQLRGKIQLHATVCRNKHTPNMFFLPLNSHQTQTLFFFVLYPKHADEMKKKNTNKVNKQTNDQTLTANFRIVFASIANWKVKYVPPANTIIVFKLDFIEIWQSTKTVETILCSNYVSDLQQYC